MDIPKLIASLKMTDAEIAELLNLKAASSVWRWRNKKTLPSHAMTLELQKLERRKKGRAA